LRLERRQLLQPFVAKKPAELVVSTPMRFANIMRRNANGEREMEQMRWGLAGRDDANPSRPKHMHVRSETVRAHPRRMLHS
jgi:putative SOS response-associated peptidase YedK